MAKRKQSSPASVYDRVMDAFGNLLPKCEPALELAETGIERRLSLVERVSLKYHSNLCLYCSCKRSKLDALKEKMRAAEADRSAGR